MFRFGQLQANPDSVFLLLLVIRVCMVRSILFDGKAGKNVHVVVLLRVSCPLVAHHNATGRFVSVTSLQVTVLSWVSFDKDDFLIKFW